MHIDKQKLQQQQLTKLNQLSVRDPTKTTETTKLKSKTKPIEFDTFFDINQPSTIAHPPTSTPLAAILHAPIPSTELHQSHVWDQRPRTSHPPNIPPIKYTSSGYPAPPKSNRKQKLTSSRLVSLMKKKSRNAKSRRKRIPPSSSAAPMDEWERAKLRTLQWESNLEMEFQRERTGGFTGKNYELGSSLLSSRYAPATPNLTYGVKLPNYQNNRR
jgi:hypothetical protein